MRAKSHFAMWASVAATAVGLSASAAAFTAGDVAVYRVGDGVATLANTGNAVFVDEYSPAGTLVQSVALPTTASGANNALIASGTAGSEGMLNRSADGRFLVLTGYSAFGTTSLNSSASATVPRVVGLVGANGSINTTTALTDFSTGNNPRSATSPDGTNLYVAGAAGGVRYATVGSTTSTQLSTTQANITDVNIADGNLFATTSKGSTFRLGQVGTGLPTAAGQTITTVPGLPITGGSPDQFFFADLTPTVAGSDTLYLADDGAGTITKYSLVGGSYVSNGAVTVTGVSGLTGSVNGSTVSLFATTPTGLYDAIDTGGYNVAPSVAAGTLIASAASGTAFRGVALAPTSTPEPASLSLFAAGAALLATRRRAKA